MPSDDFSNYPRKIRSRTQRPFTSYERLPDHYAIHRRQAGSPPAEDAVITMNDDQGTIEVFQGTTKELEGAASSGEFSPVYALQPGGKLAVPTGRVFIRFKEGMQTVERSQEIERAGYEIAQSVSYAPQAAWLQARSGKLADALNNIEALEKIADVENVEPQMLIMLMKKVSR